MRVPQLLQRLPSQPRAAWGHEEEQSYSALVEESSGEQPTPEAANVDRLCVQIIILHVCIAPCHVMIMQYVHLI